jgi:tetratricopeptide (TPR) repeat protein
MKHYYYAVDEQQLGPFTFEELEEKKLKKSTLVWTEGMQDWAPAHEVAELRSIIFSEPPPLPPKPLKDEAEVVKETDKELKTPKYDVNYNKETSATYLGVLLLVIPFGIYLIGGLTFEDEESYNRANGLIAFGSLLLRIVVALYVSKIATRQNRNSAGWGWFAFFLPSLALIIIGQLKKLQLSIALDERIPVNQQKAKLFNKAKALFTERRYSECISVLNLIIKIDSENLELIKLRGISYYKIKDYQKARLDFDTLIDNNSLLADAYFYLGNLAIAERNRELAIDNWKKADGYNSKEAKMKLDEYYVFYGTYFLDKSEVDRKLNTDSPDIFIFDFNGLQYTKGITQIDEVENVMLKTIINGNELGLAIELSRVFKKYHVAITFYEIHNIVYRDKDNELEFHLFDGSVVTFNYLRSNDLNGFGIKRITAKFEEVTGKIAKV